MMQLRILGEADVRAAIDVDVALSLARRTLQDQADGRSVVSTPSVMSLDAKPLGGPGLKFRAATVGHLAASGVRLLSRHTPTGPDACDFSAIYAHERGTALTGLVAEQWLSRMRTAAFGTAVVEHLVNPGSLVVALFGTGGIAHEIVPMLARALPVAELRVHSRHAKNMSALVAAHESRLNCQIRSEPNRDRMVHGADLIITLTESPTPLVFPGALKPGAVLCSMGNYNEVDYGVLTECQRLIVDNAEFTAAWGDGGAWIAQGHLSPAEFATRIDALACEIVSGKKSGRLSSDDRIVALVQGMPIGDIAFAAYALREAERHERGVLVDLP